VRDRRVAWRISFQDSRPHEYDAATSDFASYIAAIIAMKRARGVAILAHNYQAPEIFHGVADITRDSLALAQAAAEVDANIIVLCGVHFMAETAKLLNSEKVVLIPDACAGCSLAESITATDVRLLHERHPGVPVVTKKSTGSKLRRCACTNSYGSIENSLQDVSFLRLAAQYFFIRWLTAFRAAADIFRIRRRTFGASASTAARLRETACDSCLFVRVARCGKFFTSAAISAFNSS
jgi:hypothetical protein